MAKTYYMGDRCDMSADLIVGFQWVEGDTLDICMQIWRISEGGNTTLTMDTSSCTPRGG